MVKLIRLILNPIAISAAIPTYAAKQEISSLANSHPDYLALRGVEIGQSFSVSDLTLTRDVGVFRLLSGTVTFVTPVLDETPTAIFSGNGEFSLTPATAQEVKIIQLYTNETSVKEPFKQAVYCFTDDTQRWSLLGSIAFDFANFVQQVTPHEVAHQW